MISKICRTALGILLLRRTYWLCKISQCMSMLLLNWDSKSEVSVHQVATIVTVTALTVVTVTMVTAMTVMTTVTNDENHHLNQ